MREHAGTIAGFAASIALHGAFFLYGAIYLTAPELGFEFELPTEVEFGLTEEAVVMAGAPTVSPPEVAAAPPPEEPLGAEESEEGDELSPDAGVADAGIADAGPDAGQDAGQDASQDAGPDAATDAARADAALIASAADAGAGTEAGEGEGEGAGEEDDMAREIRLPAGAQIALRVDMARIRVSPLAPQVRRLLDAIPDWHAVLDGAEIDPLNDLERVLIASPNLQRSRMVLAGRYDPDRVDVNAIVARMASARGTEAPWGTEGGVPVAPWANADETVRVVAKIGQRHFAITRPEDLPTLLAIAQTRAESESESESTEEDPEENEETSWADALLSMEEGAALTVEVEGARRFVRGMTRGVPMRLRVSVEDRPNHSVRIRASGDYESPRAAAEAVAYWDALKTQAARNALVRMMGFGPALTSIEFVVDELEVRAEVSLGPRQIRTILDFLRSELEGQARRRRDRERRSTMAPRMERPSMTSPPSPGAVP